MSQEMDRQAPKDKKEETTSVAYSPFPMSENAIYLKASDHATDHITCETLSALNENELKSVHALLAYVANNQHVQETTVQAVVEARFGVVGVEKLPRKDYEEVIRFLVDLCVEEMLH